MIEGFVNILCQNPTFPEMTIQKKKNWKGNIKTWQMHSYFAISSSENATNGYLVCI